MNRSPLSRRISDLSEWIGYHLDDARDGRIRDPNAKRAWVRRTLEYVHLLAPDADTASTGFLPSAFRHLSNDLKAIDELPKSPDWVTKLEAKARPRTSSTYGTSGRRSRAGTIRAC